MRGKRGIQELRRRQSGYGALATRIKDERAEDRRKFPRISASFPIEVETKHLASSVPVSIIGKTTDLSEKGAGFVLEEPLSLSSTASILIGISPHSRRIKIPIQTTWSNSATNKERFLYGGYFTGIRKNQFRALSEFLWLNDEFIRKHINHINEMVNGQPEIRSRITGFFTNDVKNCLQEFIKINREIKSNKISNGQKIDKICNEIVKNGNDLEKNINQKLTAKKIKQEFRVMLGDWIYQSQLTKRAFEKPRGYPGDYKILEYIYNDRPISNGIGFYFDRCFLNNPYASTVRNRKNKIIEILRNFIETTNLPSLSILNLASGSCRELKELFLKPVNYKGRLTFTCIDYDEEALDFSKKSLRTLPQNVNIKFLNENVLNFCKTPEKYFNSFEKQNLVYSIGLVDYLPDGILKKLICFCYELLYPEGKFIFAYKDRDADMFAPVPPAWFCDWNFIPRDEEQIVATVKDTGIENVSTTVEKEPSQRASFLILQKNS